MAYPPAALPTNATDGTSASDTTPTAVLTAAEVNATNAAVNDIVTELGSNPSGASATVGARLDDIEADVTALGSGSIPDGSVSTAKLADGAVTAAKVAADVATQAELDAETAARTAAIAGLSGTYARKASDWASGVPYVVGELVVSAGTLYRCTAAHVSSGSFAAGNFAAIGGGGGGSTVSVTADGALTVNGTTVQLGTDAEIAAAIAAAVAPKANLSGATYTGTHDFTGATVTGISGGIPVSTVDAKGDLLVASGNDTVVRKGVGANGQLLTADSTSSDGLAWVDGVALAQAGDTPVTSGTAAVGTSARAAKADHSHALPASAYSSSPLWGNAVHGDVVLDGVNTFSFLTKVDATTYQPNHGALNSQDLHFGKLTLGPGVSLRTGGVKVFAREIAVPTGTGTIIGQSVECTGTNNSAYPGGTTDSYLYGNRYGSLGAGFHGAGGGTGVGASASNSVQAIHRFNASAGTSGNGGAGSSGAGGTGVGADAAALATRGALRSPVTAFNGSVVILDRYDSGNPWAGGAQSGFLMGGQGGGAGAGDGTNPGGAGGCGGPVVIVNAAKVSGNLVVTAPGSAGGSPTVGNCGGGGGGAGGVALLNSRDLTGWTGTVTAPGGAGGAGVGTGVAGTAGGSGTAVSTVWS